MTNYYEQKPQNKEIVKDYSYFLALAVARGEIDLSDVRAIYYHNPTTDSSSSGWKRFKLALSHIRAEKS